MAQLSDREKQIRKFILQNVERCPKNIVQIVCTEFTISRQAANKHLQNLVEENLLSVQGKTRGKSYEINTILEWEKSFPINDDLKEDVVWSKEIEPYLQKIPQSALDIWNHGFTEMLNNAIDHSEGESVDIHISMTAVKTEISLYDDGIGIFKKIQKSLNLVDVKQAAIELAKGKFTTAPDEHSGEGIFFTSRMLDSFELFANGIYFTHAADEADKWLLEEDRVFPGTTVTMRLDNDTSRSYTDIFNQFSSDDDHTFYKTIIPVKLAQYSGGRLVSRSQAKRLLMRCDQFKKVVLDFEDISSVGQAFADEVFRVFAKRYPAIDLSAINESKAVDSMIQRAKSH